MIFVYILTCKKLISRIHLSAIEAGAMDSMMIAPPGTLPFFDA